MIDGALYTLNIDLLYEKYWSLDITSASYGKKKFSTASKRAILDTGTSFLTISQSDYTGFEFQISSIEGIDCSDDLGYCYSNSTCSEITSTMNDFTF